MASNSPYGWMTGTDKAQSFSDPTTGVQSGGAPQNPFGNSMNPDVTNAVTQGYYTANPQAGYNSWLNYGGLGGQSDASNYGRAQYGRYYDQYLAALPGLGGSDTNSFMAYLNNSGFNPGNEFYSLGSRQQGQTPFLTDPRTRFTAPS